VQHLVAPDQPPIEAAAAAGVKGCCDLAVVQDVAGIELFIEVEQQLTARLEEVQRQQQALLGAGGGAAGGVDDEELQLLERRLMSVFWGLESEDLRQTLVSSEHRRELLQRLAGGGRPEEAPALARLVSSLGGSG